MSNEPLTIEETEALRQKLLGRFKVDIKPRRIRAIHVNSAHHWQPPLDIEIGKSCAHLEQDAPSQRILAIFEATTYIVVTPERGFETGLPYFFAKEDVRRVVLWE